MDSDSIAGDQVTEKNKNSSVNLDRSILSIVSSATSIRTVDDIVRETSITSDTECGIWCFRGPLLQKFANKKAYVILYGLLGCIFSASTAYYNGTITTIEKRFKIPSKTIGIIAVGNHVSQLFVSGVLSYYTSKGHRPRWIALGIYMKVLFCLLAMLPHILFGPGDDALQLTEEYSEENKSGSMLSAIEIMKMKEQKFLCRPSGDNSTNHCTEISENIAPQIIFFTAKFLSGIGGSLLFTLGVSYMDDNIQKSKTPALISVTYFIRMLGPALGYGLASITLKFYISPTLTPTISTKDPRWLGAWWMGWIIFAVCLFFFASIIALFPKTLPRAAARKILSNELSKSSSEKKIDYDDKNDNEPASIVDMIITFKRLLSNKTFMFNNSAAIFFCFGYSPYWIFMPKYIETLYKQSASASALITGTVGLVFSAFGLLLSGIVISKYKPKARYLAAWNIITSGITIIGIISFVYVGCPANDEEAMKIQHDNKQFYHCNDKCNCDYVTYNPVCSQDSQTFISACHAGCQEIMISSNGTKEYTDCSCINSTSTVVETITHPGFTIPNNWTSNNVRILSPSDIGNAVPSACPVDCKHRLYIFLGIICILKFIGAAGRATNFLVSVRCVEEKDKAPAMGLSLMMMSLFALIPAPILFGFIFDKTCLVWGKTCTGTSNCWMYDSQALRYILNFTAAGFVTLGMILDVGVWYFVKDVKIFDNDIDMKNINDDPIKEK